MKDFPKTFEVTQQGLDIRKKIAYEQGQMDMKKRVVKLIISIHRDTANNPTMMELVEWIKDQCPIEELKNE